MMYKCHLFLFLFLFLFLLPLLLLLVLNTSLVYAQDPPRETEWAQGKIIVEKTEAVMTSPSKRRQLLQEQARLRRTLLRQIRLG